MAVTNINFKTNCDSLFEFHPKTRSQEVNAREQRPCEAAEERCAVLEAEPRAIASVVCVP